MKEKLSTLINNELEYLKELQEDVVKLEEDNAKLTKENINLISEAEMLRNQVQYLKQRFPHYKPGDTITLRRWCCIGELTPSGFYYTKKNYDKCANILLENNVFFVELFDINDYNASLNEEVMFAKSSDIIGRVISYTESTITIKLHPEALMPEIGQKLLESLTKQDFEEKIRVAHKMIGMLNHNKKTFDINRIVSCYLIDILNERKETMNEIL